MAGMPWVKFYTSILDESDEVMDIYDKFGITGFGRYWMLIAMLGKKFSEEANTIALPSAKLRESLGFKSYKDLNSFLLSSEIQSVFNTIQSENYFAFDSSILLDLKKKNFRVARQSRKSNFYKRENKEERNKEIDKDKNIKKESFKSNISFDEVMQLFNDRLAGFKKIKHTKISSSKEAQAFTHLKTMHSIFKRLEGWEELFQMVKKSSFLCGQNGSGFVVTLGWLCHEDNTSKVLNGQYQDPESGDSKTTGPESYDVYQKRMEEERKAAGLGVSA